MIYTQELLILFTAIIVVAALAVGVLTGVLQSNLSTARGLSSQVEKTVSSDFDIIDVHGTTSELNIYLKGIAGSLDLSPTVFIDGVVVDVNSVGFIRDGAVTGKLDPGDLAYITVLGNYLDGKQHDIRVVLSPAEARLKTVIG